MRTADVLSGPPFYVSALSILRKACFTDLWESSDGTCALVFKNRITNQRVLKESAQMESERDPVEALSI